MGSIETVKNFVVEVNSSCQRLTDKTNTATILLALFSISILLSLGATIYLPFLPLIKNTLQTTEFKSQLIIIIFLIGSILSRIWWRSISDVFGIRKAFLFSVFIQLIAHGCIIRVKNIDALLFWRCIQASTGGIIAVLGQNIISSLAEGDMKKKLLNMYELSFPVAYSIAPFIGVSLLKHTGLWWSGFLFMTLVIIFSGIIFYKYIPETGNKIKEQNLFPLLKFYKKILINRNFIIFNTIVGLVLSDNMMFMFTSLYMPWENTHATLYQYAWFIFFQNACSLLGSLCYPFLAKKFGREKCINYAISLFVILGPLYLYISYYIPSLRTLLAILCCRAFIIPFFVPGLISKALDINFNCQVLTSAVSIVIRSIFMIIAILIGTLLLDNDMQQIFTAKFFIVAIISVLFVLLNIKKFQDN